MQLPFIVLSKHYNRKYFSWEKLNWNYLLFVFVAETPRELPKVDLPIKTKKVELLDIEMPTFEKKPSFTFPLRDRFIQERDTIKLTASVDTATIPAPTVGNYGFGDKLV